MIYDNQSYLYYQALTQILNSLEKQLENFSHDEILNQILLLDNREKTEELVWLYENRNGSYTVKNNLLAAHQSSSECWVGKGEYFYCKIYDVENAFLEDFIPELFFDFITIAKKIPGILRINFFGLSDIFIKDHKDDEGLISGYHTFVASLNHNNQNWFKINEEFFNFNNSKYFFYDVNAIHSAGTSGNNWWYIITIDIDDQYINCKNNRYK